MYRTGLPGGYFKLVGTGADGPVAGQEEVLYSSGKSTSRKEIGC